MESLFDGTTHSKLRDLYPDFSVRMHRVLNDMERVHGMFLKVTYGIRTMEEQAKIYAQGRTFPGPRCRCGEKRTEVQIGQCEKHPFGLTVTKAKPGQSMHHYGIAADVCFKGPDPYLEHSLKSKFLWSEYGRFSRAHGLVWGGDFNNNGLEDDGFYDRPHAQITYALTLDAIQDLYRFNGLKGVWGRFDQLRGVRQGSEWSKLEIPTVGLL